VHEISVELTFDAGHRIVGHKGKCARLHGHTYKVHIQANSDGLRGPGFVVDFGDIKDLVYRWDHKMLLWEQDPLWTMTDDKAWLHDQGIVLLKFNPTAELMAQSLAGKLMLTFPLNSVMVELWETPKAMARYVI
jgi:6-pyruvoyltetrahydropterin/6-carboxytetrahydropterin synthase